MPEGVVCASSGLLQLRCAVRVGIGAGSGSFLAERDCFITDSQQYADLETGRFFMRVVFQAGGARFPADTAALRAAFVPAAERFALAWGLVEAAAKLRAIIAVSTGSNCLARPEEHTSELQLLMRIACAVFGLNQKQKKTQTYQ